jgi:hypothetical protein
MISLSPFPYCLACSGCEIVFRSNSRIPSYSQALPEDLIAQFRSQQLIGFLSYKRTNTDCADLPVIRNKAGMNDVKAHKNIPLIYTGAF